jgi:hypothetical protein
MAEAVAFKSGKDLGEETRVEDEDTVTCVSCGAVESDQSAYEGGWQLAPAVCPDCLQWIVVADEACCCGGPS